MRNFIVFLAPLLLALPACGMDHPATYPAPTTTPSLPADTTVSAAPITDAVQIRTGQGLAVAELAYQTAVAISMGLIENGVIKGSAATRLRALNVQANNALDLAHTARSELDRAAAVEQAIRTIAEIKAFGPGS